MALAASGSRSFRVTGRDRGPAGTDSDDNAQRRGARAFVLRTLALTRHTERSTLQPHIGSSPDGTGAVACAPPTLRYAGRVAWLRGAPVVTCAACGRENKAGRRFCAGCGASLALVCPTCGAAYEPGERFCGECGSALPVPAAAAPSIAPAPAAPTPSIAALAAAPLAGAGTRAPSPPTAPVAERRLVSVLFADLVGFTPFAAERDAEDVRAMLSRYFDLASDVITRYGGTVEKFIGDAVMAVWGAPTTHEDDAERAVRAGLELVDAVRSLGPTIQARAGVLTGEAAVTLGAINQGMVAGDIVNTAARLQSVAQPGTVLVGESTQRATAAAIAYETAGPQNLKGKESPVPAYRALRVVAEVGGRNRQEGLEAPFVGRDDEMRQLKDLFHASARDRRVRLVSVVGPAGIGKSRLAWEFVKYLDGLAEEMWWHQGRSPAYGNGIAFWALGEMVRGRCRLAEGDDERTTRAQVAATVAANVPDEAERAWIEPALLALLGVGGRAAPSEQLFAAWRTFFERLAASAPVVMLFEDLHWADSGTLDFIDHVLEWTRDLPITIVTLARPELLERRPDWGAGKRHFVNLFLEPLTQAAMHELLAGLVPGLPERAARAIVARADGIPLYAVETVRSLLAEGRLHLTERGYEPVGDLSELAVPETLTALIAARLDALDPADRSLLQDAAVLGQSFTPAALADLADQPAADVEHRLRGLVRREILSLQADPRSPERGQYAFVQALIREVAYNTLAKRDRRAKHLAAARWFEAIGSDELAGALARHYLAAWQATPEGPEADALAGQARLALQAAADRAVALFAMDQAVELWNEALTVTTDPAERGRLLERISTGSLARGRPSEAEQTGRAALAIGQETGDLGAIARAATAVGNALNHLRLRQECADLLDSLEPTLRPLGADPDLLRFRRTLAVACRWSAQRERVLPILEDTLVAAERLGDRVLILELMSTKASFMTEIGRTVEGLAILEAAAQGLTSLGREDLAAGAWGDYAVWSIDTDPAKALEVIRRLVDLARRTGNRRTLTINASNGAEVAIATGEWDWALTTMREVLRDDLSPSDRQTALEQPAIIEALRGGDPTPLIDEARALTGGLLEELNHLDDRLATAAFVAGRYDEASRIWRHYAEWSLLNSTTALPRSGRAQLWAGDVAGARADLEATIATGLHSPSMDAGVATLQAGLDALEGRAAEARRGYRDARTQWRDLNLTWLEALTCLDQVLLLGPDDPDAEDAADRARDVFTRLGARPFLAKLDEALAGSPVTPDRSTARTTGKGAASATPSTSA
ncbi:MAG: adenylate/guanylate cyclase domain-containing protein [Chloroflexota bacterium]